MSRISLAWFTRRTAVLGLLLVLCLLAGCYEQTIHGNKSVYQFAWWLGPLVILLCLLGLPLGWLLREGRFGWALMIASPILLLFIAPVMYSDYVLIDDDHFEARYGFWFSPTRHNLRFQDLREIRYVAVPGNRGRIHYEMHCLDRNGQTTVVHAGDLVRNTVPEIMGRAQARGVQIVNQAR